MRIRSLNLLPALGLALLLTSQGAVAEAGFVSDSLAAVRGEIPLHPADVDEGAGRVQADDAAPLKLLSFREATIDRPAEMAKVPGGMSAPTPDSTGSTSGAPFLVELVTSGNAPMVVWLGAEGKKWLPPPF